MIDERRAGARGRRESRGLPNLGLSIAGALLLVAAAPAWAHRQGADSVAPATGISIPNLSHGQMAVIADNRAAILDLAGRQTPTDPIMRRLEAFINLRFFACAWGMAPGSLEDENSPFNECTHAYLAAARALLVYLQAMPGDRAPVRALVGKIELEMLSNSASLVMCRYSDQPFNTADVIAPHWADIPSHPPSLLSFMSLALAIVACAWTLARWKPRSALGA